MEFIGVNPVPDKILRSSPGPDENSVIFQMARDGATEAEVIAALPDLEPANVTLVYRWRLDQLTSPEAGVEAAAVADDLSAKAKDAKAAADAAKGKVKSIAEKVAARAKDAPPSDPLG
jgi:hypothetical protein